LFVIIIPLKLGKTIYMKTDKEPIIDNFGKKTVFFKEKKDYDKR
jgi:hypothetical protein